LSDHRPLRIAHVTATFPPYQGGTGNVCFHNARVLAERGHDVHVYTATWPGEADDPPGVTVHRLRPLIRVGNAPVLPQLARLRAVDLVHLHFPFYSGGALVALSGVPYVVAYHQDVQLDGWIGRVAALHDRTVGRFVLRRAARLCPTSLDYLRHSAISELGESLSRRVVPIPNGVDPCHFRPGAIDREVRRRHGLPERGVVALFVGAMDQAHHFKGVPTFLRALAGLADVSAILVGAGELVPSYQRLAVDLGLGGRVVFAGRVDKDILPVYYRSSDLLVLPSETAGEAFGMVLLEAMACGRPVIASDLPGVRGVVSHGCDGLLVPPRNVAALSAAIATIARMPAEARMGMGLAGRAKVERDYNWGRIGDLWESLYADAMTDGSLHRGS
jgi:glycosyltransferase involved in cell wall biosynthesis